MRIFVERRLTPVLVSLRNNRITSPDPESLSRSRSQSQNQRQPRKSPSPLEHLCGLPKTSNSRCRRYHAVFRSMYYFHPG